MPRQEPIDDLDAYIKGLTSEELRAYGRRFGRGTREWMIMEQEFERRKYPLWAKVGQWLLFAIGLLAIARWIY